MRALALVVTSLSLLVGAGTSHAIEVGDIFWLSSNGVSRTVVDVSRPQNGIVEVSYRILADNASEFCVRYPQHKPMSPEYNKCVQDLLRDAKGAVALVNCRARSIVLEAGSFQKGNDHFWKSKADPNSFVLGDELFEKACER
jgi:hypothetical protein